MKRFIPIFFLAFITINNTAKAQTYSADWASIDSRPLPQWYPDAKFGIFIHWGIYSVPSWATSSYADGFGSNYAEWYWQRLNAPNLRIHKDFVAFHEKVYGKNFSYKDFAPMFKAELYNPEQWAHILKNSGAKYVVLTSKHHDGFALWPAPDTKDWNAVETGPRRDVLGELTKAVKDSGMHMGFYYSLYEWYNPLYKSNVKAYVDEHMIPQIKDLVTRYEPDIFWPDGEWEQTYETWKSKEIIAWLFNQPEIKNTLVINDRWGNDTRGNHGSFNTSEYGAGNVKSNKPWEECRGIGQSFGYNRNENLEDYATGKELIHQLIKIVANGGNFLLNIGPAADGSIPVIMQQRLKETGDWLQANGDAIYGTTQWPNAVNQKDSTVFFTQKGNNVYALMTVWKKSLSVNTQGKMPKAVTFLSTNQKLNFTKAGNGIRINMPLLTPDQNPGNTAWACRLEF